MRRARGQDFQRLRLAGRNAREIALPIALDLLDPHPARRQFLEPQCEAAIHMGQAVRPFHVTRDDKTQGLAQRLNEGLRDVLGRRIRTERRLQQIQALARGLARAVGDPGHGQLCGFAGWPARVQRDHHWTAFRRRTLDPQAHRVLVDLEEIRSAASGDLHLEISRHFGACRDDDDAHLSAPHLARLESELRRSASRTHASAFGRAPPFDDHQIAAGRHLEGAGAKRDHARSSRRSQPHRPRHLVGLQGNRGGFGVQEHHTNEPQHQGARFPPP